MAASTLLLGWLDSVLWMSVSLFLLGLGWNISYVAAVAELADRALPAERGKLIGFTDGLSSFTAVVLVLARRCRVQRVRSGGAGALRRRSSSRCPPSGFWYDPPPAHPMCALCL